MKIAILGWGSLIWDRRKGFDGQHEDWQSDGPNLKLEFSRVSQTRCDALTLVLDAQNGTSCRVAYAISKRENPDDAICDLRCREGTTLSKIGFYFADGTRGQSRDRESLASIGVWAAGKKIDVVIWTDLESNFKDKGRCGKSFSIKNALCRTRKERQKPRSMYGVHQHSLTRLFEKHCSHSHGFRDTANIAPRPIEGKRRHAPLVSAW